MALYESLTAQSTPEQIAAAYKEFTGTTGGDTKAAQEAATNYLTNLGISTPTISSAYQSYLGAPAAPANQVAQPMSNDVAASVVSAPAVTAPPPLYQSLTAQSTPEQIAAAYNQAVAGAGGDTQANQKIAIDYLAKLGVAQPAMQTAYDQYKSDYASGIADKLSSAFGGANPQLSGILSGFEAMNRGDFTEDQAKRLLGADTFGKYQTMFGNEAKRYTDSLLADKSLTGQEAIDFMQNARKYGVDANEFAQMTGYKPDLYTNLQKSYDTTVNNLVDKSLEGKTDLGDRIKTGLALQSKYGFTDEDLAKATDLKPDELKSYLDPVRNFSGEFNKVTSAPDASGKDILSFVENAKKNQAVNSVYGTNLDALDARLKELDSKWSGYGVDGYQAENVYNQLSKITNAVGGKNWTGDWKGGGDNAAKEATKALVSKGVDNLSDLKVMPNYEKATANAEFYQGMPVQTDENGGKYVIEQTWDGGGNQKYLPAGAQTTPVRAEIDAEGNLVQYKPLTEAELKTYDPKTGTYEQAAGNKLVDASSGKVVAKGEGNNFVLNGYSSGNFFKGKDHTLGLMMTDSGVPVPYQTTSKSGFLYSPAFPIMASLLLPGVGSALSSGIASATSGSLAAGSLANSALTQGIMSGTLSKLGGGEFEKGFVGGAVNPLISAGVSSLLPTGMDPALAKTATNVGTSVASSALTGRPIDWTSAALNAGIQYGAQQLPFNLTPQQLNLLGGIATPLLQNQAIDPVRLGGILANYAIKSQTPYNAGAR